MTAFPDVDEPFTDKRDVVDRLLPYHIYQHPQKDFDAMHCSKGKGKATEANLLREELAGMLLLLQKVICSSHDRLQFRATLLNECYLVGG